MVQKIYFRYISMSSYKKHSGKKNSERFEPRNHVINKWNMIFWVSLVPLLTVGKLKITTKFTTTMSVDWERTGKRTSVSAGKRKLKVTQHSYFVRVPSYFDALWYPHLYFDRKSNILYIYSMNNLPACLDSALCWTEFHQNRKDPMREIQRFPNLDHNLCENDKQTLRDYI